MWRLSAVVLTAIILLVCSHAGAQTVWFKYEGNPVLVPGPLGSWDQVCVAPSRVIFEDSLYRMWYSATNTTSFAGWRVGHATSRDGAHWVKTPPSFILDVGPGVWENASASWPEVIRTPSGYKMWYTGTDGPSMLANLRLGYATSPDGLVWTKFGRPVFGTGTWYAQGAQGISVLGPDSVGSYKMWFQGNPLVHAAFQIGLATAPDETSWTARADPVFSWGTPGSWDDDKAMTPSVLFDGQKYEMFYCGERALNVDPRTQIGYATSPDGITWTRSSANPVLRRGPWGWDAADIIGNPVILKDNIYHMWYGANATVGWSWTTCYAVSPKGLEAAVLAADTVQLGDTVRVRVRVLSPPGGLSFFAELESPDNTPLDTLALYDDGQHGDSLSGDGLFANQLVAARLGRGRVYVDLHLRLHDTLSFELNNLASFVVPPQPESFILDYFPLALGNRWTYRSVLNSADSATAVVTDSTRLGGRLYYLYQGTAFSRLGVRALERDTLRSDNLGRLWRYEGGRDYLLFDYTVLDGNTYPARTTHPGAGATVRVSKPLAVDVPAGQFAKGIMLSFLWPDAAEEESYTFVPGVGLSGWYWPGPEAMVLVNYEARTTAVSANAGEMPACITLSQNYPNPFNPTTTIGYSLPQRSRVRLAVFNTLGQKVAELVSAIVEAGAHEVTFNAGSLASGVYFYRLQAGEFVQTRSLAILR